jgi:hypothetical protein
MLRKNILLMTAILLSVSRGLQAQDKNLGVTFDLTYSSRWITKGKAGYGQQGALFATIDLDLWGSGFGTAICHQQATASGYVDKERFNYSIYYGNNLFNDSVCKTNYKIHWIYKYYPHLARYIKNSQEWKIDVSWPDILPGGLVPKYIAHYEYPAGSNYNNHDITGWVHRFGLGYKLRTPGLTEPIDLSAEVAYRDGLGGRSYDHDWSHATFGMTTKIKSNAKMSFIPGFYYQISMDDSVSKRDIPYGKLSMKYTF